MRIGLASDHVGFEPKERLKARVARQGHTAEDLRETYEVVGMTPRQFQRSSERDSGGVFRPGLPVVECY